MSLYQTLPKLWRNIKIGQTQVGHLGFHDFEGEPLVWRRGSGSKWIQQSKNPFIPIFMLSSGSKHLSQILLHTCIYWTIVLMPKTFLIGLPPLFLFFAIEKIVAISSLQLSVMTGLNYFFDFQWNCESFWVEIYCYCAYLLSGLYYICASEYTF